MIQILLALLAGQVETNWKMCSYPTPDDMRPYTLCLAETANDETERRLRRQLKITLKQVIKGTGAASRIEVEQPSWDRLRNRACATDAAEAPIPEQAAAQLNCLTRAAEARIARLAAMIPHGSGTLTPAKSHWLSKAPETIRRPQPAPRHR